MSLDFDLLEVLATVSKRVVVGGWVADYDKHGRETGRKLTGAFLADHPEIERLVLNVRLLGGSKASLQVSLTVVGSRARIPIYRIDIAPGRWHTNPPRPNDPDGGRRFGPDEPHVHDFVDRADPDRPDTFARSGPPGLVDFRTAVDHLCARFNVANPSDIPDPVTQGFLL